MVIQWAFQQLWKNYGVEHLSLARLQQCVRGMLTLTPSSVIPKTRTWDLKLSSGLLLTLMTTHLFQFRFADAEQYWLFTLTFFRS